MLPKSYILEVEMGIIQGLMGHATSTNVKEDSEEFGPLLIRGEEVLSSYKWARDKVVFTTHRIIYVDVQGLTGRKKSYMTIGIPLTLWDIMPSQNTLLKSMFRNMQKSILYAGQVG